MVRPASRFVDDLGKAAEAANDPRVGAILKWVLVVAGGFAVASLMNMTNTLIALRDQSKLTDQRLDMLISLANRQESGLKDNTREDAERDLRIAELKIGLRHIEAKLGLR